MDQSQQSGLNSIYQCHICSLNLISHQFIYTKNANQIQRYCITCFSKLTVFPEYYRIFNCKIRSILQEFSLLETLFIYEALTKNGFMNWDRIAQLLNQNIDRNREKLVKGYQIWQLIQQIQQKVENDSGLQQEQTGVWTYYSILCGSHKKQNRATIQPEIQVLYKKIGYDPFRQQFQICYNDTAQLEISQISFLEDDSEQQMDKKFRILENYNQKLNQRENRKHIALIWIKQMQQKFNKMKYSAQKPSKLIQCDKQLTSTLLRPLVQLFSDPQQKQNLIQKVTNMKFINKGIQMFASISKQQSQQTVNQVLSKLEQNSSNNIIDLSYLQQKLCEQKMIDIPSYLQIRKTILKSEKKRQLKEFKIPRQISKLSPYVVDILKICQLQGYI